MAADLSRSQSVARQAVLSESRALPRRVNIRPSSGGAVTETSGAGSSVSDVPWLRVAHDALDHAHSHAIRGTESDLRLALVGFDHSTESLWAAFLRQGPGVGLDDEEAGLARHVGSSFWKKASWFGRYVTSRPTSFPWTPDDLNEVRSERNALQHGGDWRVPSPSLVELARQMTLGCFEVLTGEDLESTYRAIAPVAALPEIAAPVPHKWSGPPMASAALTVSMELDPERQGLHYRFLTREMIARGSRFGADPAQQLYDALNRAHLTFDHESGGVFRWKPVVDRDPRRGLSGVDLSDACLAVAKLVDPDGAGAHYRFDILPVLLRWNVAIRGTDLGASVNAAMRRDARFERLPGVPGTYRWLRDRRR